MNASPEKRPSLQQSLYFLVIGVVVAFAAFVIVFTGIIPTALRPSIDEDAYGPPSPIFRVVGFDQLPGWREDDVAAALPVFLRSCDRLENRSPDASANPLENLGEEFGGFSLAGAVSDWTETCAAARTLDRNESDSNAAWRERVRRFFEDNFSPVEIRSKRAPLPDGPARGHAPLIAEDGVFTGYFEPEYEGRRTPEGRFSAPVYDRPDDLVDVDLGQFRPDLAGERIAGRIEGSRLVPYPDRRAINEGALAGRAAPVAWLDPDDLFFLQIQGSGRVRFGDGGVLRVGYNGANGRAYTAIGRVLVEQGAMTVAEASMQSIRDWLTDASVEDARALREANESYVFFRKLEALDENDGPLGAQGAPLTPDRSLAVDRRFHAMGAPVFVDIEPVVADGPDPIRRLMIAQDTGGAIRGPVRGDVFWGAGETAAAAAGAMNARGRMFVLLPNTRADALTAWQSAERNAAR